MRNLGGVTWGSEIGVDGGSLLGELSSIGSVIELGRLGIEVSLGSVDTQLSLGLFHGVLDRGLVVAVGAGGNDGLVVSLDVELAAHAEVSLWADLASGANIRP